MAKLLYDNPLIVTLLPCIVALGVVLFALRAKTAFARAYGVVFALAIAADAYVNGPWTFVKSGTQLATAFAVFFVIFGDFRYFVLLEHVLAKKLALVRAVGWAFVVPVTAQVVRWIIPRIEKDERSTFLLYELLFLGLACLIWVVRVPKDSKLARRATAFEIAQYALWAGADIALMATKNDAFYAVRLGANLMYYVAFVPVMLRLMREP